MEVCSATEILCAVVLLATVSCFIYATRCKRQYSFMLQLLSLILILTLISIADVVLFNVTYDLNKQGENWYLILDNADKFVFWCCVYICTWLVAFKYHEQSRQMLRIDRLTNQRNINRNSRAV